jgi:hypothetical protein
MSDVTTPDDDDTGTDEPGPNVDGRPIGADGKYADLDESGTAEADETTESDESTPESSETADDDAEDTEPE